MKLLNSPVKTILAAGLVAGTMDISSALIYFWAKYGKDPLLVFRYIARAVVGKDAAYNGGTEMVLLGLVLHYAAAFIFTVIFFFIYPSLKRIINNTIVLGILYGIIVWAIMNLIVVPMTRIPAHPFDAKQSAIDALILVICIGLPIALITSAYYKSKKNISY